MERLKKGGFKVNLLVVNYFSRDIFEKNDINPRLMLQVAEERIC
jgi:hypothetical protein